MPPRITFVTLGARDVPALRRFYAAGAVDAAFAAAVHAGARTVADPTAREWGGYSGYVSDPEGHRWEIAWLSSYPLDANGDDAS